MSAQRDLKNKPMRQAQALSDLLERALELLAEFADPNHRDNDWQDFTRGRCARCGEEWPCRWFRATELLEHLGETS